MKTNRLTSIGTILVIFILACNPYLQAQSQIPENLNFTFINLKNQITINKSIVKRLVVGNNQIIGVVKNFEKKKKYWDLMRFENNTWTPVNFNFNPEIYTVPSAVFHKGALYVAYPDIDDAYNITVKKFENNTWSSVGNKRFSHITDNPNGFIDNNEDYVKLKSNGDDLYIVYDNLGTNYVMQLIDDKWIKIGQFPHLTRNFEQELEIINNVPYLLYMGLEKGKAKHFVAKFNGSSWVYVGKDGIDENLSAKGLFQRNDSLFLVAYCQSSDAFLNKIDCDQLNVYLYENGKWRKTISHTLSPENSCFAGILATTDKTTAITFSSNPFTGVPKLKDFNLLTNEERLASFQTNNNKKLFDEGTNRKKYALEQKIKTNPEGKVIFEDSNSAVDEKNPNALKWKLSIERMNRIVRNFCSDEKYIFSYVPSTEMLKWQTNDITNYHEAKLSDIVFYTEKSSEIGAAGIIKPIYTVHITCKIEESNDCIFDVLLGKQAQTTIQFKDPKVADNFVAEFKAIASDKSLANMNTGTSKIDYGSSGQLAANKNITKDTTSFIIDKINKLSRAYSVTNTIFDFDSKTRLLTCKSPESVITFSVNIDLITIIKYAGKEKIYSVILECKDNSRCIIGKNTETEKMALFTIHSIDFSIEGIADKILKELLLLKNSK